MNFRSAVFVRKLAMHATDCVEHWRRPGAGAGEEMHQVDEQEPEGSWLAADAPGKDRHLSAAVAPEEAGEIHNQRKGGTSSPNAGLEHIVEDEERSRIIYQRCLASGILRNGTGSRRISLTAEGSQSAATADLLPGPFPGIWCRWEGRCF